MVHTAFNCISVIEKLPHKIEAIEIWGTAEGALFTYEIHERAGGSLSLQDAKKTFSKKPITQLNVIEKYKVLLSLSDGVISVHELPSLSLRSQMAKSRGCHFYALDKSTPTPTLCVAIKKRLVLFKWEGGDFVETKELVVPEIPKVLVWCGENICVGYKRAYNMINIHTGAISELFPSGKSANPIVTLLPNERILVLRERIGVLLDFNGKPIRKYGISWTEMPVEVAYSYPYALALQSKGVEIRSLKEGFLVQTIMMRTPPSLIVVKNEQLYVAGASQVWRMEPLPLGTQVDQLTKERNYEEALSLSESLPDSDPTKTARVLEIRTLHCYNQFSQGHFGRALSQFAELEFNPLKVIALFPGFLPKGLSDEFKPPLELPEQSSKMELALPALVEYLWNQRGSQVNSGNNLGPEPGDYYHVTDFGTIVDTTLLKALVRLKEEKELNKLLESPNRCHVGETETALTQAGLFSPLVNFYRSKGLHRAALQLLSKLAKEGDRSLVAGPRPLTSGKDHLDLLLEYSQWPLANFPDDAIKIFRHPRPPADALPADKNRRRVSHVKVLEFIEAKAPGKKELFLEHVINYQGETSPEFHNQLIFGYLDRIMVLKKDSASGAKSVKVPAGQEPGLLGTLRKKLLLFLEESTHYNPEKMLSRFPFDGKNSVPLTRDLYEERAILLGRIGQHDKALSLYVHRLHDFPMAERYCERHYEGGNESGREVYLALLQVLLHPPDEAPMVPQAISVIQNHFKQLNLPKALALLPPTVPISSLFETFQSILRINSEQRRNNQVIKNLLRAENLQVREELIINRSRVIKISDERSCQVCHKRIGLSAFAYFPNGMVVHYHCRDKVDGKGAVL